MLPENHYRNHIETIQPDIYILTIKPDIYIRNFMKAGIGFTHRTVTTESARGPSFPKKFLESNKMFGKASAIYWVILSLINA